jgi:DNA-binding NarL/FixJ family response regulator
MPLRVVLGEDTLIVREGIAQMLSSARGVDLVASCADEPSLLVEIERERPDVVLTDIRMPPSNTDEGIRIAAGLRESHPEVGVVVLSNYSEPPYALALLESGSHGRAYLLKERLSDRAELIRAIEAVAEGDSVIDPTVVETLIAARSARDDSPLGELTARELEILAAIAEGMSNAAIAEKVVLTKRAVEKHINAIFLKLGFTHSPDVESISKRVTATLIFLGAQDQGADPEERKTHP